MAGSSAQSPDTAETLGRRHQAERPKFIVSVIFNHNSQPSMKLHEIAVFTDQIDSMIDFYERLLDAKPAYRGEGIAVFKIGDVQILLHSRYEPGPAELPCENHTAFAVPDVDRAAADLAARGIAIAHPPKDYDWGRSAYLYDPDGRMIELHGLANG